MKKYLKNIFITVFLCCLSIIYAQSPDNYPVKTISGVTYYIYTVQSGEGLYSISKKFGVSQSDINNANPQIQDGLKAGAVILVPKTNPATVTTSTSPSDVESTEYIMHKVEKKQTLFAISRLYNVSQDDIIKANPQIENGLRVGDTIRIPQKKIQQATESNKEKPTKQDKKKDKEIKEKKDEEKPKEKVSGVSPVSNLHIGSEGAYIIHVVQPKETLYSLGRQYNVSVNDIIQLNPGTETSLKAGTELKIPALKNSTASTVTKKTETYIPSKKTYKKDTYKIAYLLPFMLDDKTQDATVNKFVEFYMGSLLAVKEARNNNTNYEIYTYDTEKSESKLYTVMNKPEMQKMDLIIGPAYSAQVPILADFAKRREIYTVVPFSSNIDDIDNNPYVFQFNPDKSLQSFFVVNALKNRFQDANVLLVNIDNSTQSDEDNDFFNFIDTKLENSNIDYKKVSKSDLFTKSIQKFLISGRRNIIIFDTYKLSSVQSYLNELYDLGKQFDVSVIGQYTWRDEKGKKPKMYYVAPFMNDSQRSTNATNYESEYTNHYGKLRGGKNPRFDMIGYDITKYFLSLMTKDEFKINDETKNLKASGMQSDMFFKRTTNNGGFMNQQLFLIEDAAKRN